MAELDFEGNRVPIYEGDTIAAALFRAGVRTFTRSVKHHRRRGLYCLTGDCPNCLVTVDGDAGVRSCCAAARNGQRVRRESGWPSAEHDLLGVADHLHALLPVGFYYKAFTRPRWLWPVAERVIRRATGLGSLPLDRAPDRKAKAHRYADVLVIGGGVAGLSAARAAGETGARVLLVDEGRLGEKIPPGATLERIRSLAREAASLASVRVLERHTAIGVYEGPLVPVVGPEALLEIEADRIVIATGAVETHPVFPGNDLPGVWLGRGAARMAGVHRIAPGGRAVVVVQTEEGLDHLRILQDAGVEVVAALVEDSLADGAPEHVRPARGGRLVEAHGRRHIAAATMHTIDGARRIACDVLVVSMGFAPRDGLLRQGAGLPVTAAGQALLPECDVDEAEESGARAGAGTVGTVSIQTSASPMQPRGYVCLCEDVGVGDLERAWDEGWTNVETLKRYTTATMGPCQGALCGRHLAAFAAARGYGPTVQEAPRVTSRPPARPVRLEDISGGVDQVIPRRTALHEIHLRAGARLDWSGSWLRPFNYGDVLDEYRAVRERVSIMDVSTLGKFLVAGRDARRLLDEVFPCRIADLEYGRTRYLLALDEAGYVFDDGLVCGLGDGRYFLTSTSGGADAMEAWLRNWVERLRLHAHVVNQTAMLGAINVAGPSARALLERLTDDSVSGASFPHASLRRITVAGLPCLAVRVGFVGELSFELHHPRARGPHLWHALMAAGADLGVRPHGLDSLDVLRLEKGHLYLSQDTLPDDHPHKLGLEWVVASDKAHFVGRAALQRMAAVPLSRKLVGLRFAARPERGAPLLAAGEVVGRITSCASSPTLGYPIGLGWIRAIDGEFPTTLDVNGTRAHVVPTPFYDPAGARMRA
jgi:sarcosine oxidase subunit alpha